MLAQSHLSIKNYSGKPITETITNGFFTVDRNWTVQYWNKAAETLLDVKIKDIVGKNLWKKFPAAVELSFYTVYKRAFLQEVPIHFEEYWAPSRTWFDVIAYNSGDLLAVSFKKLRSAEQSEYHTQQLRTLNELYRFITEVTNECLWEWDFLAKELFWIDGGHKRLFGYEIENALIPQSFWESCLHPEDKQRVLGVLGKILVGGTETEWDVEYRFQKLDGEYLFVHDTGHLIYENGKVVRMIGATEDITRRIIAESNLLETEKRLALITRQTVNAVIITDADQKITYVNDAFVRITEYELDEIIGKKPGDFLQGKATDPKTIEYLKLRIQELQPFDCEIVNYSKSGRKYWMRVQGQAIFNDLGICTGFFAIQTDTTESVLLKRNLELERQLKQREINDAILSAQESERENIGKELHDNVNQILVAALLYLKLATSKETKNSIHLKETYIHIRSAIEEIRKLSKILIPLGMQHVGLMMSIKDLISDLSVAHPLKIRLLDADTKESDFSEKLKLNIFRIVQEQLNNIIKHSHATEALLSITRMDSQIILSISDNGKGCNLNQLQKGVGLINIKSRADLFGGKVKIETSPGNGYRLLITMLNEGNSL